MLLNLHLNCGIILVYLNELEKYEMCKIISSETVIGNFIIEAVEKEDFKIEISKLFEFDTKLSQILTKLDYYTNLNTLKIVEFAENYPFFVKSVDDGYLNIVNEAKDNKVLTNKLERYFRFGMPKSVIDQMQNTSKALLE